MSKKQHESFKKHHVSKGGTSRHRTDKRKNQRLSGIKAYSDEDDILVPPIGVNGNSHKATQLLKQVLRTKIVDTGS